jgi:uncharacterized BrkB/YihY/UPF0761 family membrane protein
VLVALGLTLIYRYGPSRAEPRWQWITWGSAFAAAIWLAASALFSWYAANFGSFNKTYGSLGAIIGFMTWMWVSIIVVLLGAKLNAEIEHQTARESTVGAPKPRTEVRLQTALVRPAGSTCQHPAADRQADCARRRLQCHADRSRRLRPGTMGR